MFFFDYLPQELNSIILYYVDNTISLSILYDMQLFNNILSDQSFWLNKYIFNFPLLDPNIIRDIYHSYYSIFGTFDRHKMLELILNYNAFKELYKYLNNTFKDSIDPTEIDYVNNIRTRTIQLVEPVSSSTSAVIENPVVKNIKKGKIVKNRPEKTSYFLRYLRGRFR